MRKKTLPEIDEIWSDCRKRFGKDGSFLFGRFSAADAMFAPVVHRLMIYAVDVSADARNYMATMMAFAPFKESTDAALKETLVIDKFEGD